MTKIKFAIAAVLLSSTAAIAGPAPEGAKLMMFDGCEAYQVEGTNYYNFVNPRCKTNAAIYSGKRDIVKATDEGEGEGEGSECGGDGGGEGTPS